MKFLRILLYVVAAIAAIYLILCAVGPKDMNTTKSAVFAASPSAVFEEIQDFEKWPAWSPWAAYDTAMKNVYSGTPGAVGHRNEWKSDKVGSGSQEIVEIRSNELIRTELKFDGWDGVSYSNWLLEPVGDSTKVTWTMEGGEVPFLFRGMMTLMGGKKAMEKDYTNGLNALKPIVEAKPKTASFVYEVIDIPETWYLGKRMKLTMEQTDSALFANTFGELFKAIGGPDKVTGMLFAIGHEVNMETGDMDLEIAVPVSGAMKAPQGLHSGSIPAGRCARYIYKGAYDKTGESWNLLMAAIEKDQLKMRHAGYEVYANDPSTVKDASELITWLMLPVE